MPRETVHWFVLEEAAMRISQTAPQLFQAITRYEHFALFGALAHDAPYYHRFGGSSFEQVAERLHGSNGEETHAPLFSLIAPCAESAQDEKKQKLAAFAAGMFSHSITDRIFHPLVYYFTGNYYADDSTDRREARSRHRMFEVWLDSAVERKFLELRLIKRAKPFLLADLLRVIGEDMGFVARELHRAAADSAELQRVSSAKSWVSAFKYIAFIQRLVVSKAVGSVARPLLLARAPELEALLRINRDFEHPWFNEERTFRNPATCAENHANVWGLAESAVVQLVMLFNDLESILTGDGSNIEAVRALNPGLSLNVGVANAGRDDYRHFSSDPLPFK